MHALTAEQIAENVLAFFLIIAIPIWDYVKARSRKTKSTDVRRMCFYRRTLIWLWIATAVAAVAPGLHALLTTRALEIPNTILHLHVWIFWTLAALLTLAILLQPVMPIVQAMVKYRHHEFIEPRQLEPMRFILPSTRPQRYWFSALALTAGFCEEVLFRGFLLRYLHLHLHWNWLITAVVAAIIFGAHHLYQGLNGFISTTITGLIFTIMFWLTGSLWPCMIYHAAADLSVLAYWRPKPLPPGFIK
jgi:membrane protease YdiL (CAAX protease family)